MPAETRGTKTIAIWQQTRSGFFGERDGVAPAATSTALEALTATGALLFASSPVLSLVHLVHDVISHASAPVSSKVHVEKPSPGNAGGGNLSGWIRCARISRLSTLRRPGRLKYPHPSVGKTRRRERSAGMVFPMAFFIGCHSTRCFTTRCHTSRRLPFFPMRRAYFVLARANKKRYKFLCSPRRVLAEELCAVMPDTSGNVFRV
jgi:hypothetical protein